MVLWRAESAELLHYENRRLIHFKPATSQRRTKILEWFLISALGRDTLGPWLQDISTLGNLSIAKENIIKPLIVPGIRCTQMLKGSSWENFYHLIFRFWVSMPATRYSGVSPLIAKWPNQDLVWDKSFHFRFGVSCKVGFHIFHNRIQDYNWCPLQRINSFRGNKAN